MKKLLTICLIAAGIAGLSSCGGGGGGGGCSLADPDSCGAGKFCAFLDGSCGAGGAEGTCMEIPSMCPEIFSPVCTCDALTFDNECSAFASEQSVQSTGECA